MGSIFTERPGRRRCDDFSFRCMASRLRGCSSLFSAHFPIAITWSRPITPASTAVTGQTRKIDTFDHIAETMNHFTEALSSHALHALCRTMAALVGFRLGAPGAGQRRLSRTWPTIRVWGKFENTRAFWADRTANGALRFLNLLSLCRRCARAMSEATSNMVNATTPDLWTDEFYFLNQPARSRFSDLSTITHQRRKLSQVASLMREKQPGACWVIWGVIIV